jgi:polypeptide N-acetylgalactosaminyltransferase
MKKFFFFVKIRNYAKMNICVDSQEIVDQDKPIIAYPCHGQAGNQFFLLTKNYEIRYEDKCLDYAGGIGEAGKIRSMLCHSMQGNQMWFYEV